METAYVENGVSAENASTTVGTEVIKAVAQNYQTNNQIGNATIEIDGFGTVENITGDATISIYTTDFIVEGTIYKDGGQLIWGEIEDNVPGIKIINIPSFISKEGFATLDVKRRHVSNEAQVTWTSLTTDYATVDSNTGKVTGVAEGNSTIKASVTDGSITYTAECTIPVREIVMPQVGDFVNYDAGTWMTDTNGKILIHYTDGSIGNVNNSTSLPSSAYEFGGFTTTSGKNGNALSYYDSLNNRVKEKIIDNETTTIQDISGWRIFDISNSGITLISAGCPEGFKLTGYLYDGYICEYVLTGEDNSPENVTISGLGTTYKARDWTTDYGNKSKNITASVLTKSRLEEWYRKYVDLGTTDLYYNTTNYTGTTGNTIFCKVYTNSINNRKYESLIDNNSSYWLSCGFSNSPWHSMYYVEPAHQRVDNKTNAALGLRILINLPSSITLTENRIGTKTITSRNNDCTYNFWGIN